jgi:hypothetical protein
MSENNAMNADNKEPQAEEPLENQPGNENSADGEDTQEVRVEPSDEVVDTDAHQQDTAQDVPAAEEPSEWVPETDLDAEGEQAEPDLTSPDEPEEGLEETTGWWEGAPFTPIEALDDEET